MSSFSIRKSHKFVSQHPEPKKNSKKDLSKSLLSEDDYSLFNMSDGSSYSGKKNTNAPVKTKKGGNYIRPTNSAQADYY